MQYIAHETGSSELDSANAVDAILRPLERLSRSESVAVLVTDHEPWAEHRDPGRDHAAGTMQRPRHSGAKVATADYVIRIAGADSGRGSSVTITYSHKRGSVQLSDRITIDMETGKAGDEPQGDGGGGEPMGGGGGRDHQRTDDAIRHYIMKSGSASQRAVCSAVTGRREYVVQRLRAVAELGENRLWVIPGGADPTPCTLLNDFARLVLWSWAVRREPPSAPCVLSTWGGNVPRRSATDGCPVGSLRRGAPVQGPADIVGGPVDRQKGRFD